MRNIIKSFITSFSGQNLLWNSFLLKENKSETEAGSGENQPDPVERRTKGPNFLRP
jgi:hypothetical protein